MKIIKAIIQWIKVLLNTPIELHPKKAHPVNLGKLNRFQRRQMVVMARKTNTGHAKQYN